MSLDPIKFNPSKDFTVGVELETQVVDPASFALVPESTAIIDAVKGCRGFVKHELLMSNLEVTTGVCNTVGEAHDDLLCKLGIVIDAATAKGTRILFSGTHPYSRWEDQVVTEDPRYHRLLDMLQLVARRFNIFGLHVHVGVAGPDRCIYIMNRMLFYLPHLLALSSNSPFWESMDTGLRSYRTKVFESLPVGGMPFYFKDWDDYTALVHNYINTDTIETIRELWWDIRPHPDFGTIETRICDMPPTLGDCMAIAALVQALVKKFDDDFSAGVPFKRPHPSVVRENKWRACRWGLDGEFMTKDGGSTVGVREAVGAVLDLLEDTAKALGSETELSGVRRILEEGTGASRQKRVFEEKGELREVARDLSEVLYREVGAKVKALK